MSVGLWPEDDSGRILAINVAITMPGAVPYLRFDTRNMVNMVPELFGAARAGGHETISAGVSAAWGSEVEWDLGCIHLVAASGVSDQMKQQKTSERSAGKFYLCFHWQLEDPRKGVGGVYVQTAPRDEEPDPLEMLETLDLRFADFQAGISRPTTEHH